MRGVAHSIDSQSATNGSYYGEALLEAEGIVIGGFPGKVPVKVPTTISEVNLKGLIQGFEKSLADEGKFFGWGGGKITKAITDFTKDGLLKSGWTKERLQQVAQAYEHIARITPANPSAAGRAAQLRELLAKFFSD